MFYLVLWKQLTIFVQRKAKPDFILNVWDLRNRDQATDGLLAFIVEFIDESGWRSITKRAGQGYKHWSIFRRLVVSVVSL